MLHTKQFYANLTNKVSVYIYADKFSIRVHGYTGKPYAIVFKRDDKETTFLNFYDVEDIYLLHGSEPECVHNKYEYLRSNPVKSIHDMEVNYIE